MSGLPKRQARWVSLDQLHEDPANVRKHGDRNRAAVRASLKEFGQVEPLVVQAGTGRVLGGNCRLAELRALGQTEALVLEVDVAGVDATRLALALNQTAVLAEWDEEGLEKLLRDLSAEGLEVPGFDEEALAELLKDSAPPVVEEDEDAPLPVPAEPVSRLGEVYELGPHRLVCGDCRDPEVVARLLNGRKINLAFTSPPYASQRQYDESSGFRPIPPDQYVDWFEAVQANVRAHLAEDGSWFVNIKAASDGLDTELYVFDLVIAHARRWGWRFAAEFCWERVGIPGKPVRRFKNQFEPIFQFALAEWKFRPLAVRHASDKVPAYSANNHWAHGLKTSQGATGKGWANEPGAGMAYPGNRLPPFATATEGGHSAAYPVALPEFFILAYTDPADAVLDPFMGSGTTLIAAAKNSRIAYGTEISPRYCDVIRRRWTRWARANNRDPGPGALEEIT